MMILIVLFQIYWSTNNHFTAKRFDKVIAEIKWCSFFAPQCTLHVFNIYIYCRWLYERHRPECIDTCGWLDVVNCEEKLVCLWELGIAVKTMSCGWITELCICTTWAWIL